MSADQPSRIEVTHYEQHRLRASYIGPIDRPGAVGLIEIIDSAFGYYQYTRMELSIESPGGLVEALGPMVTAIRRWQARGRTLEMRSTFECASAAALLLAAGTWGQRCVLPGTSLMFHLPRVVFKGAVLKSTAAERLSRQLRQHDQGTLNWLCSTVARAAGGENALARCIEERVNELRSRWADVALALSPPLSCEAARCGRDQSVLRIADRLLSARDFYASYKKAVATMLEQDAPVDLRLAYVLGLVDRIKGVLDGESNPYSELTDVPLQRQSHQREK